VPAAAPGVTRTHVARLPVPAGSEGVTHVHWPLAGAGPATAHALGTAGRPTGPHPVAAPGTAREAGEHEVNQYVVGGVVASA